MYSTYDVVVAGGGPAGSAIAIMLARQGLCVALLDAGLVQNIKIGEGLPPSAKPLLRKLDVLACVEAGPHLSCIGNQSAWGGNNLAYTDFISNPQGNGWHLDRLAFDANLRERAQELGTLVMNHTRLTQWQPRKNGGWRLIVENADGLLSLACRWLVDAGGRKGRIARSQGAKRKVIDRLMAFAATYRLPQNEKEDMDSTTLIESTIDGWWYTARIPGRRRVVVFHTDASHHFAHQALGYGFKQRLNDTVHIAKRVQHAGYQLEQNPCVHAANTTLLNRFVGDHWLAVGDAATSFDPLSSQGIHTALYSGVKAGECLGNWFNKNPNALEGYASDLLRVHKTYMEKRCEYYNMEHRWGDSAFWMARKQTVTH